MTDELQTQKQEAQVTENVERIRASRVFVPQVDIYTAGEEIVILADMPGVSENDIDISLEKNVLTINGFVSIAAPDGYELVYSEYGVGDFQRSFTLSEEIDQDKIEASLSNGMLHLRLPKVPEAKARKIAVTVA
jgi:HSP20 family molecular chaperone IbpA